MTAASSEVDAPLVDRATRLWRGIGSATAWGVYGFLLLPSLIVIPLSFGTNQELVFPPKTLSLMLYREYFQNSAWMQPTLQSLIVATLSTTIAAIAGFFAAYALVRLHFPGKRVINLVLLSPIMVPAIVVALGSYFYFSRIGLGATPGLILAHAIHTTPFVIVTTMAALRHVDANLEAAAALMGAGRLMTLRRVTLPLALPGLVAGAAFAFLISFDEVVIAYFVTGPETQTLPVKMYSSIQWQVSPVIAAISALLTLLSLVVCVVGATFQQRQTSH